MSDGLDRQVLPVALAQLLESLEQPAIDQHLGRPVSSRYFEPVTVRAAPRNVSFIEPRFSSQLSALSCQLSASAHAAFQENSATCPPVCQNKTVSASVKSPARSGAMQAGHRLGRVGRIEKERLGARQELDRFARLRRWHAVAVADEPVVDLDRGVGDRARVRIRSWTNQIREARQNPPDVAGERRSRLVGADADDPRPNARQRAAGDEPGLRAAGRGRVNDDVGRRDLIEELRQRRARTRPRRAASTRRSE